MKPNDKPVYEADPQRTILSAEHSKEAEVRKAVRDCLLPDDAIDVAWDGSKFTVTAPGIGTIVVLSEWAADGTLRKKVAELVASARERRA